MTSFRAALVVGLGLILPGLAAGQVVVTVGPNIDISRRSGNESETAIAIDRSNTSRIVVVSNWDTNNMFRANTTNGGTSWSTGTAGVNACCDPWLGSDTFGNIYLSYITNSSQHQTVVARSTNGGASFSTIATVGTNTDHPELAVGPGPSAGQQSVWVAYHDGSSVQTFGATSTGLGATSAFTTPQPLTGQPNGSFGSVAVGPSGQVATTYMTPANTAGPANLPVWSNPTGSPTGFNLVNTTISTQVGGFRSIPAQPMRDIDAQTHLQYDSSGGPHNGTLYFLYTQAPSPSSNDTNIVIRRSTDHGATWSGEVRINNDVGTHSQFFGRLAVDQTTGNLAAVWLDARNSADNTKVELWGSVSTDGGATWLPNFKISQGQWDGRDLPTNLIDANEMGDYISLDYYNGKIAVAWADASNSTGDNPDGTQALDIYFASIDVSPVPEPLTGLLVAAGGLGWWLRLRRRQPSDPPEPPVRCLLTAVAVLAVVPAASPADPPRYADRWVYCMHNLQVGQNGDEVVRLIDRAKQVGYTGIVLADYKFNILDRVPEHYFKNAARVKQAADAAGLELIPGVFPIGYSSGLLAHDPNLAEGLPVKDAPYIVKGGQAVLRSDVRLRNGDFEEATGDRLAGLGFQDGAGKFTFVDRGVAASGKQSVRFEATAENARLSQKVAVRPWGCYRMTAKVKTKDFKPHGEFKFLALGANGRPLTFHTASVKPTQDWAPIEVVFNSLAESEVTVYVGAWGGQAGTAWVDDWRIDELSLVNVLRRDACPLVVKSADGRTVYEEGKDFEPVRDPKLGQVPYAGEYKFDHPGPPLRPTPGSRIKDGDKLLVSWYHPVLIHGEQVACSLSDPKVFDLLADQARRVNALLKPKTWFFGHDEIRVAGWSAADVKSGKTPGELLAENVRRCVGIVRGLDPGARVVVWSDMFDPNHNAVDKYYLVNGTLKGSWEGLPKDVVVANWNGGKPAESLKWFADRGHRQVIAGYYDAPDLRNFRKWDAAAKGVPNVVGFMYTTWARRYDQLEAYGQAIRGE